MDGSPSPTLAAGASAPEIQTHKEALLFIEHLGRALKIIKIYEPNNLIAERQINALYDLTRGVLLRQKEASLLLRQSSLFFNGTRIRFTINSYEIFKFLTQLLKKRGIGLLTFLPGLSREALQLFLLLLGRRASEDASFEVVASELKRLRLDNHIAVEPVSSFDIGGAREADTIRLFFMGISHLKEMFTKFLGGGLPPLTLTRRLMQSIFDHISENEAFLLGLTTVKNFDEYTLNHSMNVCILTIALGRRLGLDKNELAELGISAFFHDYGKMELPKEILDKPGALEADERKIIESHVYRGAEKLFLLKESGMIPVPVGAINVAMEHHVNIDLTGYPTYQKKNTISFFSKIVKVCDVFDALTTPRPYRPHAFRRDQALSIMAADTGVGFDPVILKVFINMMGLFPVGSLVLLDTGEIGIVVENHMDSRLFFRPKVRLVTDRAGAKIMGPVADLTETNPETKRFERSIVKSLDPEEYRINVSDYFLTQGA
ncbi:MAG: HD-GYP domain-containing protein [Candidatus Aminicenantes bacterium]|nr:HD-GYP domain-containing protein [Candidatus Aminicenantes bacterium]